MYDTTLGLLQDIEERKDTKKKKKTKSKKVGGFEGFSWIKNYYSLPVLNFFLFYSFRRRLFMTNFNIQQNAQVLNKTLRV
jgi:hypothetical protein